MSLSSQPSSSTVSGEDSSPHVQILREVEDHLELISFSSPQRRSSVATIVCDSSPPSCPSRDITGSLPDSVSLCSRPRYKLHVRGVVAKLPFGSFSCYYLLRRFSFPVVPESPYRSYCVALVTVCLIQYKGSERYA